MASSKMKRSVNSSTQEKIKNNLVNKFKDKIPKENITRQSLNDLAAGLMRSIETSDQSIVGSQKGDIVYNAFNELLNMIRSIPTIQSFELGFVDEYLENRILFDNLARLFTMGFKQIVDVTTGKKGFGCCSG